MTIYPATHIKTRCIEYDPITIRSLESNGILVDNWAKEYRGGTIEKEQSYMGNTMKFWWMFGYQSWDKNHKPISYGYANRLYKPLAFGVWYICKTNKTDA